MQTSTREDQIKQRAFDIYQARGRSAGQDQEDWLQAEREVMQEHPIAPEGLELDGIDGRELKARRPAPQPKSHRG